MQNIKKSEFNDAIGYINRINLILFSAQSATEQLDSFSWHISLDMFFKELSTYMNEEEIKYFRDLSSKIFDYINNGAFLNNKMDKVLYNMLMDYELKLRKIYDRSDLIGKKQDNSINITN